jgi:hypothetical protein
VNQRLFLRWKRSALIVQCAVRQLLAVKRVQLLRRQAMEQHRRPIVFTPSMRLAALEKHARYLRFARRLLLSA